MQKLNTVKEIAKLRLKTKLAILTLHDSKGLRRLVENFKKFGSIVHWMSLHINEAKITLKAFG
jgi:hypothetical protein